MQDYDPNLDPRALAAQNSYLQALLQRLPFLGQNLLGNGMAQQAAQSMQGRPAQLQTQEEQALGMPMRGLLTQGMTK